MFGRRLLAFSLLGFLSIGCSADLPIPPPLDPAGGKADDATGPLPDHLPKRIILMIGDGMGPAHVTGGAYLSDSRLHMLSMKEMGFISTHEHEFVTTDSAASATAMASGSKTHFGGIGVTPGTSEAEEGDTDTHLDTVMNEAMRVDWRTGLVVTTSLVDATPASFVAHRSSRSSKDEIAEDVRHSGLDVMIGGGTRWFEDRSDNQDLTQQLRDDGYSVAKTRTGLRQMDQSREKVLALLAEKDMPAVLSGDRAMTLEEMTDSALQILDNNNDDGFFLMVEGSWIDRESHALKGPSSLAEVIDFDNAVGHALEYARNRDDTLVIVTADHETGGLAILDSESTLPYRDALGGDDAAHARTDFASGFPGGPAFVDQETGEGIAPANTSLTTAYGYMSLASRNHFSGPSFLFRATHSASMVPLFAEGPGAEFVSSIRDNADLGILLKRIVAEDGGTAPAPPEPAPETPDNVILIVSDGAGLPALTAGKYVTGSTTIIDMPVTGLIATHAKDALVSDIAAASTSLASGQSAEQGAMGRIGNSDVANFVEAAEASGLDTALVTTSTLDDPALAGLLAHVDSASDAVEQISQLELDLVFAGGLDAVDASAQADWQAQGVTVETSWSDGTTIEPTVRFVSEGAMAPASERLDSGSEQPSLAEMTETALASLEARDNDFLMVVYADGARRVVDQQASSGALVDEISDLNAAVSVALEVAAQRGDTAVVVLSLRDSSLSVIDNHYGFHKNQCGIALRCGGTELLEDLPIAAGDIHNGEGLSDVDLQGDFSPLGMILQYAWVLQAAGSDASASSASANFTPLFAAGIGTKRLEGFATLAEVGEVLSEWLTR
jgi:alkaline phosphatase